MFAGRLIEHGTCWLWVWARSGKPRPDSYATFQVNKVTDYVHRCAYTWATGESIGTRATTDLTIDHLCRTKGCANPAHLELVSRTENTMRGMSPMAKNARKTHCKRGHLLAGGNVYAANGKYKKRRCKTCMRAWLAARRRREGMKPAANPDDRRRKLDKKRAKQIKVLLRRGANKTALARQFGVSQTTIHNIDTGRTWATA